MNPSILQCIILYYTTYIKLYRISLFMLSILCYMKLHALNPGKQRPLSPLVKHNARWTTRRQQRLSPPSILFSLAAWLTLPTTLGSRDGWRWRAGFSPRAQHFRGLQVGRRQDVLPEEVECCGYVELGRRMWHLCHLSGASDGWVRGTPVFGRLVG